jgi:hypothetical protein
LAGAFPERLMFAVVAFGDVRTQHPCNCDLYGAHVVDNYTSTSCTTILDHSCTAAQPFRAHSDGVYVVHTVIDSYRREKKAKVKLDAKQLNALTGKCRGKVGKEGEGTTATH